MEFPSLITKNVLICILSIYSVFLWRSRLSVHDQRGNGTKKSKGNNLNELSWLIFKQNPRINPRLRLPFVVQSKRYHPAYGCN